MLHHPLKIRNRIPPNQKQTNIQKYFQKIVMAQAPLLPAPSLNPETCTNPMPFGAPADPNPTPGGPEEAPFDHPRLAWLPRVSQSGRSVQLDSVGGVPKEVPGGPNVCRSEGGLSSHDPS